MGALARTLALFALSTGLALTATRIVRAHGVARHVPGGILIGHPATYDRLTRVLLGSLFDGIARDVAAVARPGVRVLEVGCGPGHLSITLADRHGLDVTGLDLDPAMIERARTNAGRSRSGSAAHVTFRVGDVAALPFEDGTLDLVVSTFSMHHWSDPDAGIREIARVLAPGGRALIWDLAPGAFRLAHAHVVDPTEALRADGLRLVGARPWRWPWRLTICQRIELVRD